MSNQFGLIFDLDGTMINNMDFHKIAWKQMLNKLGLSWTDEQVKPHLFGTNAEIYMRVFGDVFTPEEIERNSEEKEQTYRDIYKSHLKLVSGLTNLLDKLKEDGRLKLAIGTSAPKKNVDFVLDGLNIRSHFSVLVTADDVKNGKPHPETFMKAAELLNIPSERCLVFEDVAKGVQAAQSAGMNSIVITTTHPKTDFESVSGIVKIIDTYNDISVEEIIGLLNQNSDLKR